jgi:hypothetical protein
MKTFFAIIFHTVNSTFIPTFAPETKTDFSNRCSRAHREIGGRILYNETLFYMPFESGKITNTSEKNQGILFSTSCSNPACSSLKTHPDLPVVSGF